MRSFLVAGVAALLAACNPLAQLDGAGEQIDTFHEQYSAGDFDRIYAATDPQFRQITTQAQWAAVGEYVTERLGPVQSSERSGFNVNTNNGTTTTVVTMTTQFELGEGTETFTFMGQGDAMRLAGWEVNSDALIDTAPVAPDAAAPQSPPQAGPREVGQPAATAATAQDK